VCFSPNQEAGAEWSWCVGLSAWLAFAFLIDSSSLMRATAAMLLAENEAKDNNGGFELAINNYVGLFNCLEGHLSPSFTHEVRQELTGCAVGSSRCCKNHAMASRALRTQRSKAGPLLYLG
jgi:hypothetical protein